MSTIRTPVSRFTRSLGNSPTDDKNRIGRGRSGGVLLFRPEVTDAVYVTPSWNGTHTVIRIFPATDEDGRFLPCRVSEEEGKFTNWNIAIPAVTFWGKPPITVAIGEDPDDSLLYENNPFWILYKRLADEHYKALREQKPSRWSHLFTSAAGQGKMLSKPEKLFLVQAAVMKLNSKTLYSKGALPYGMKPDDPTVVFGMVKTSVAAFNRALNERKKEADQSSWDVDDFMWKDIVDLEGGAFVHFYQAGNDPRDQHVASPDEDPYASTGGPRKEDNDEAKKYACHISVDLPNPKGISLPNAKFSRYEETVSRKVRAWDSIIDIPTEDQQIYLINKHMPAPAVIAAFQYEHPEWILDETRDKANGAARVPVNGTPPRARQIETNDTEAQADEVFGCDPLAEEAAAQPAAVRDVALPPTMTDDDVYGDDPGSPPDANLYQDIQSPTQMQDEQSKLTNTALAAAREKALARRRPGASEPPPPSRN